MKHLLLFILTIFAFDISACTPHQILIQPVQMQSETGIETLEEVYLAPGETNAPVEMPVPVPTIEATTYQDESTGFEFDHPAGWTFDGGEGRDRDYYFQFYSWDWNPSEPIDPLPAGETILSVTVQFWDPKYDLEAFIDQRKLAWDASGVSILSTERLTLAGDRMAVQFIVQGHDGVQSFYLLTTNGESYLVLSGHSNLDSLADIAHTVR